MSADFSSDCFGVPPAEPERIEPDDLLLDALGLEQIQACDFVLH
jgi:hypothetical protein